MKHLAVCPLLSTHIIDTAIMEDSESLVETTFVKSSETDSIRPVTVYQALRSERLNDDVEFTLDGVKFSKVSNCDLNVSPLAT